MTDKTDHPNRRISGRLQLLLLIAIPVAALVAAFFYRPGGTMNHGDLVQPARPIADLELVAADATVVHFSELRGKWTFVYFGSRACPRVCRDSLYKMRQVRLAQGKNIRRVQYVWVVVDGTAGLDRELTDEHPRAIVLSAPPQRIAEMGREFALDSAPIPQHGNRIYLVDPLGNLMMSYGPDADPSDIYKDLARLLRVSRIG